MLLQATKLHEDGDSQAALTVICTALAADPDNTALLMRCAWLKHIVGKDAAALDHYAKASQLGVSLSARESLSYGLLLMDAGHLDAVIEVMLCGLAICEPDDRIKLLSACSLAMFDAGRVTEALQQMLEADSLGQLSFSQMGLLATLHELVGDVAAALATYDRAVSLNPLNPAARCMPGLLRFQLGDAKGCIIDATAALQLCSTEALADRSCDRCSC